MDKIKLDSFIDVYLIGSLSSLNIRLDHTDKKCKRYEKKYCYRAALCTKGIGEEWLNTCCVSDDEYLLLNEKKQNESLLNKFEKQMNLTTGVAENTSDLRVWFLIKGDQALNALKREFR